MAKLTAHPAANLFPMLGKKELAELASDIAEEGQKVPIVIFDGKILDGRNRYAACKLAKVAPKTKVLERCESPTSYVLSTNLHRRHLTSIQSACVAVKAMPLFAKEAKARQKAGGSRGKEGGRGKKKNPSYRSGTKGIGRSTTQAAKATKAGKGSVVTLAAVQAKAPDVFEAVSDGIIDKVSDAKNIAAMEPELRTEVLARIKDGAKPKEAIRDVRTEERAAAVVDACRETNRYRVLTGDLAIVSGAIASGSVDVIITDPPYPKEFLHVYGDLARVASRILKPGGSCVVMIGQSYLPDIIASMAEHLTYQWTLAYLTPGGQAAQMWDRKVNTFWKPLLWFVNGEYQEPWIGDVVQSKVNDNDKTRHKWGQSESGMADIIDRFSEPGQTILDPFCGGGTTGSVALQMGRKFVGIDKDEEQVQSTLARLMEIA